MNEWQRRTRVALDAGGHVESVGKKLVRATKRPLLCLAFVAYSFCAFAAAPPYEPPEFRPPAWLVGIRETVSSLFAPRTADPPVAIATRATPRFSGAFEAPALDGGAQTQALISGLPLDVGRIVGTPAVTATGNATYTIPLWLPPGARGIQPELSIVYASGSPDDLLGPGWSLEGLSAISRCNKTWTQDGTPEAVSLSNSDKFCLDGNRLRLTGGTYGAPTSTYQTEIETFTRVTAYGTSGNGPMYFHAEGKDGRFYVYGGSTDSRAFASGASTPYAWLLSKVIDRQGNNLIVTYSTTSGAYRPESIQYTETPGTGAGYPYTVSFSYQTRVTNLSAYVAGGQIEETQVLGQISVSNSGALVRTYAFGYETAPTTQRDRLIAIQECTASSCLPVTNITYQNGQSGFAAPTLSADTGPTNGSANTVDMNGDGLMDLVYATASGSNSAWWVKFASSGGFGSAVSTGVVTTPTDPVLFDDFDANGTVDLLSLAGGVWHVLRWNGSAFTWTSTGLAIDTGRLADANWDFVPADVNGDGLPDLVSYRPDGFQFYTRLNTTSAGAVSFSATATLAFTWVRPVFGLWGNNSVPQSSVRHMDFNGDGRDDVAFKYLGTWPNLDVFVRELFAQGSTFADGDAMFANNGGPPLAVLWNDDHCTDLSATGIRVSSCSPAFATTINGGGQVAMDWDGDGRTDLLNNVGGTWQVTRSLGTAAATPVSTGVAAGAGTFMTFDQNGDGLADLAHIDSSASNAINYGLHNGVNVAADLATTITDGFGMNASFSYSSIATSGACYYRDSGPPTFPNRILIDPVYTACSMTASNGSGGTYEISSFYYNSNVHLQGRGWLGFERRYAIDSRDGIVNMEIYAQTFPYIGMTLYTLARQSDWTTRIREITNTLDSLPFGSGYDTRSFPYVKQADEDSFEVGGSLNGQWIKRATTATAVDSYGNPTTVTTFVVDKSTASPWYGETFTTQTVNAITNDPASWCLGLPTETTVTSILPDSASQTRTTAAVVDYVNCRVTQEMVEPASTTLRVTTTYGFDSCGNVGLVNVVGKKPDGTDMPARTTTSSYGARCTFVESVTNPLGQTSTTAYNYSLGLPSSRTDPNSLTVSWLYDGYGRKTRETRPDGTITIWSFTPCEASSGYCGVADLRWYITEDEYDAASTLIRYKRFFHDGFNRLRYDGRKNLAGGLTWHAVIGYDARGNEWYRYNPYETSNNGYTSFTYDLINRPTVSALYNSSGAWDRQSLIAYVGPAVTFTDPKGNVTAKYHDVRGQLRQIVDPAPGGTTHHSYDPFGNLTGTVDPIGAVSTSTFNLRGFKTASNDPDAGSWAYEYNSLGELLKIRDAKTTAPAWTTVMTYDALGRMTTREDVPEALTSTWTWGTSAAAKNIGKLSAISSPGYSESYLYDLLGRAASTTFNADTTYQVDYTYHLTTGYLETVSYPASTNGCRFTAQYGYLNGILRQVTDASPSAQCGTSGTVLWLKNAEDARGQPTEEILGNGVRVISDFDGLTGALITRKSGNNPGYNNHQHLAFAWDKGDNLTERSDLLQSGSGCAAGGLCEKFYYDALDRLDRSTLNGLQNLDVTLDAAGNITDRTDVGIYAYHPIKRHAVESTTNGWTFSYDANGNMLTGRGATIAWTSYNKPSSITNGSIYSQFSYTPNRQYWRQVAQHSDGAETTIYVGGLLEKATGAGGYTEYRHMVGAGSGTVIVSRSTSGTNQILYATRDHLDSSAVITNQSGAIVTSLSFGAYGERRRNSGWSGPLTTTEWNEIANTTRRGFTGHTMVDNLSLVHMNGRVYDPIIGRFLSPDPIIQTLELSQALNPYSYVMNNPLKYIDPSGYSWLSKAWKKIKRWFKKALLPTLASALGVFVCGGPASPLGYKCGAVFAAAAGWAANRQAGSSIGFGPGGPSGPPPGPRDWGGGVVRGSNAPPSDFGIGQGCFSAHCTLGARAAVEDLYRRGAILSYCEGGACTSGIEQGLYDWFPGYAAGTCIYNAASGGSCGIWEGVDFLSVVPFGTVVTRAARGAAQGARLTQHLRQLEKYGAGGSKELANGRIRYYGSLEPARDAGTMAGRRLVREWDPATGATRTWHETMDSAGRTRIVRPETGGPKVHHEFDEAGNYVGSW